MNDGTFKVYGDPEFAAIQINGDRVIGLPGQNGRYQCVGAKEISMDSLSDSATIGRVNDITLIECFDAHTEQRKPRFIK